MQRKLFDPISDFGGILRTPLYIPLAEKISGRKIQEKLVSLKQWGWASGSEKRQRYIDALSATVAYAGSHVPYYRDLFRRIKFNPENIRRDLAWLNDIPYLTKEIVNAQPERFLSDAYDKSRLIERKTSGSTGLTLSFFYSRSELDFASAVARLLDQATGRGSSDREVHLRLVPPGGHSNSVHDYLAEMLKRLILNRRVEDVSELSVAEARRCLKRVHDQHPFTVYALRSTFESLLHLVDDASLCLDLCKVYVSTGETLDKRSADFISNAVGCQVFNRYGNAEFGAVAQSESDTQSMRFVDGVVWPENFTVSGMPEIVLTTLHGRAMPLIRYRTGDLGYVQGAPQDGFRLENVLGRLHDVVHVGDHSYTTAYFSEFLLHRFAVHDFQIFEQGGQLEFRVVTDQPDDISRMSFALSQHLGQEVNVVRIRPSDLLRRGRQMKFSHVIRSAS